jgi:hypothetical protein
MNASADAGPGDGRKSIGWAASAEAPPDSASPSAVSGKGRLAGFSV